MSTNTKIIIGIFAFMAIFTFAGVSNEESDSTSENKTESNEGDSEASTDDEKEDKKDDNKDKNKDDDKNVDQTIDKTVNEKYPVNVQQPIVGDPYAELDKLIGLDQVKAEVRSLANYVKVQKQREAQGMKTAKISYHCVFSGNPGTGKTTIARILARIYKDLGIVSKGQFVETDRGGLIAEYVGQTAQKTMAVCNAAKGGVLFIDEAYAITDGKQGYGDECVSTLLKFMEDNRDDFVVIVAGYKNEMKQFIDANPGLESRFTRFIDFPDYSSNDLYKIFKLSVDKYNYVLTPDADAYLQKMFKEAVAKKSRYFGNARYARNLFEQAITNQSNRLGSKSNPTKTELAQLTRDDLEKAYRMVKK